MIFWGSLVILVMLFLSQLFSKFKKVGNYKVFRFSFWGILVLFLLLHVYFIYAQYSAWKNFDGVAKFLVPPYASIWYVVGYVFMRFGFYYFISLFIAFSFFFAAKYHNKKFGGRFFEPEEPYFGALAIFLLGNGEWHYAWIIYLILLLVFSALGSVVFCNWLKKMERFPLYWLWIPTAIAAIIIGRWLPAIISNI